MATRQQVQELRQKTVAGRAELVTAVRSLSPEDLRRVPVDAEGEEQWTALEQLSHLWEMERNYDAWVRAALAEDGADLAGIPHQGAPIPIELAHDYDAEDLLRGLEVERAYTLGLMDGISLEGFDRRAVSPVFGSLTVLQWLRSFYRHDRQHTAQMLGRKSDYQPNFATGAEPNQRKARIELVAKRGGITR